MSALMIHTEFQQAYDLDHAALSFLSAMYYQQKENGRKPVEATQEHIKNMTGVGIYAQRRVRKTLSARGLLSETRKNEAVKDNGWRTKIYYDVNCSRLDKLLEDVEAKMATMDADEERRKIESTTVGDVKESSAPAVKMHMDWMPDDDALSNYLKAYGIDGVFAVYDVLPEFIEYWIESSCEFRPIQWQAKFHAAVRHQWQGDIAKRRNQAKIMEASELKANAIAAQKAKEAQAIMNKTSERFPKTSFEMLTDRSWADGVELSGGGCNENYYQYIAATRH